MSLVFQDQIKERVAELFVHGIGSKVILDQAMTTRVVVNYFIVKEKGLWGSLSLCVKMISDRGLSIVPIGYAHHLLDLLKESESSRWKGFNKFRCYGISVDRDYVIFRIEFENLQDPTLPNYRKAFSLTKYKALEKEKSKHNLNTFESV